MEQKNYPVARSWFDKNMSMTIDLHKTTSQELYRKVPELDKKRFCFDLILATTSFKIVSLEAFTVTQPFFYRKFRGSNFPPCSQVLLAIPFGCQTQFQNVPAVSFSIL
jgi:hypothetical protein